MRAKKKDKFIEKLKSNFTVGEDDGRSLDNDPVIKRRAEEAVALIKKYGPERLRRRLQ